MRQPRKAPKAPGYSEPPRAATEGPSGSGTLILDADYRVVWVDQTLASYFGFSQEALLGQDKRAFVHAHIKDIFEDPERVARTLLASYENNTYPERFEARILPGPGREERWVEHRSHPIELGPNQGGRIEHYYDITKAKQTETALRASEARYRTLLETMDQGFCVIEVLFRENNVPVDYRFLEMNPAFEELTGLQDALGKTIRELVPNFESHWVDSYGRVALTGEPARFADSSEAMGRWFDVNAFRVGGEDSRKVAVFFTNITERKRAEAERNRLLNALEVERSRLLTMFEEAPAAIATVRGPEHVFEMANPRYYQLVGHRELIGKPVREALPEVVEQGFTELLDRVYTTGEPFVGRGVPIMLQREPHDAPQERYVDFVYQPLRDADGTVTGIFAHAVDVTDHKRAAEALERAHDEMERRVAERTAELAALNAELESFNYSVSHDLRAPLRGIDGFSQVLLEDYGDELDDEARGYLQRIRAGAERMGVLIDDLMDLSRLSKSRMKRQPVDLSALAQGVLEELRAEEPERQVEVRIQSGMMAEGDHGLLRLALENLLANAWKFTRERLDARIEIGATEEGAETVYYVRDNGAGFDMRYAEKLFAPFQRLHSESEFAGTGVGLTTVQRIIRQHGGRVWAEAAPEKGATFFFTVS